MKSKILTAVAALMLLAPVMLSGQTTETQTTSQAKSENRTPQARIEAALSAAAKAQIPAELLKSKVAEGEAKRVPPDRIATAVEARLTSLVRASDAMKRADVEWHNAGELAVAADAIAAGVTESALIRVSREAPDARRTVAVAVLADLVRLGNESEQALLRVNAALSSSASLANLHAEVASQLRLNGLTSTLDAAGIIKLR